jgi:beta-lactamase class D
MERFVSPLLTLFSGLGARADVMPRDDWQMHFDSRNMRGTFVLLDAAGDRYLVHDEARARQGLLPASTFEIANALIGLEVGSIADEREVFAWDGKPRPIAAWERDHTLDSGMRASAIWMFQEVARRTGRERMREWLARLDYGNRDISGGIDLFWLQGRLRVSAMQQVDFLRRLAEGALAMSQRSQRLVRHALAVERTPAYTLYAKSGTACPAKDPVSWWVGWVERKGRPVAYFAMNFTPTRGTRYEDRFSLARAILAESGVLPGAAPEGGNVRH